MTAQQTLQIAIIAEKDNNKYSINHFNDKINNNYNEKSYVLHYNPNKLQAKDLQNMRMEEPTKIITYLQDNLYVSRIENSETIIKNVGEFKALPEDSKQEIRLHIKHIFLRYGDNKKKSKEILISDINNIIELYNFLKKQNKNIKTLDKAYYACIEQMAKQII